MTAGQDKLVQYLAEARAHERALTRELQGQITVTPRGSYRSLLERHLTQTRQHVKTLERQLERLGKSAGWTDLGAALARSAVGQALSLGKLPLNVVRGAGGEEKQLKNAKDACAAEALEIATYDALERLADRLGDQQTAKAAAKIRDDEEKMLAALRREIASLTDAVIDAEVHGKGSFDIGSTGAAETARAVADSAQDGAQQARKTARRTARRAGGQARQSARQARRVPGVTQVEGEVRGAVASADDLAIADYDTLNAEDIIERLPGLAQVELAKVDAYERKNQNRSTVLDKVSSVRGDEPWSGYDEMSAEQVRLRVEDAPADQVRAVREYERRHKDRKGVLQATDRQPTRS